ncbi:unnamed protein product [Owenia fusiformis]|uniref:Uncharacterized protein n=1 Tax=Owenia fusiformis TaxID=6347 RepID=A0A8J1V0L3_OWEFU|nr:unnamed protein product [Owenia fusiformis]
MENQGLERSNESLEDVQNGEKLELNDMSADETKISIENENAIDIEKNEEELVVKDQVSKYELIVGGAQKGMHDFFYGNPKRTRIMKWLFVAVLIVGWLIYLGFATAYSVQMALPLIIITGLVILCVIYYFVKKYHGERIWKCCLTSFGTACSKASRVLKWVFLLLVLVGIGLMLYFLVGKERPKNLISAVGACSIVLVCFVTSANPAKVKWRPVLWGLGIQLVFGLVVLRWSYGFIALNWIATQLRTFLAYANFGSSFVFGALYCNFPIVFQALPQAVFFSSIIGILFHFGVIQQIILKLGWLMEVTLGTTAIESVSATANILVSSVEGAVIIRDWLPSLTYSELHAVMCGGFATVAGDTMAVFIAMGAPAEHVLTAAIMSAPAALALAKLSVPETDISTTKVADIKLDKPSSRNFIEAAANGAVAIIKLASHMVVNLIAAVALLSFVNAVLFYLGAAVGFEGLSFPWICSKVLKPLAYILGVSWEDTEIVGELIGTKIFANEFLSYLYLDEYYQAGKLSARSRDIATYTLCGFGSLGDIGINVGAFGAFAPSRRSDLSEMGLRALNIGNLAGFLTASIAGLLSQSEETYFNATIANNATFSEPLVYACP